MLTKDEAQRIALCVNALRPDWATNGLMTVLADQRCRNRVPHDLTLAFVAMALDPQSRRPGRIFEQGPWWSIARPAGEQSINYRTIQPDDCAICSLPQQQIHADHEYEPRHARNESALPTPEQRAALEAARIEARTAERKPEPPREPRDPAEVINAHLEEKSA